MNWLNFMELQMVLKIKRKIIKIAALLFPDAFDAVLAGGDGYC